jgi:hypothetical protein
MRSFGISPPCWESTLEIRLGACKTGFILSPHYLRGFKPSIPGGPGWPGSNKCACLARHLRLGGHAPAGKQGDVCNCVSLDPWCVRARRTQRQRCAGCRTSQMAGVTCMQACEVMGLTNVCINSLHTREWRHPRARLDSLCK